MKIVSSGGTISSPEFQRKKRRLKKIRLIIFSISLLILLVLAVFVSRLERFLIKEVHISGAEAVNGDEVSSVVREVLSGHYLWLIPRSNTLLYPRDEIRERIATEFPRFGSVALSLEGLNELVIGVSEREPYALFCLDVRDTAEPCYFVDVTGIIFDKAPLFSGMVYFIYTSGTSLGPDPRGQAFLPPNEFKPVARFVEDIILLGFHPVHLVMSTDDHSIYMNNGSRLLLPRGADMVHLHSNLVAFLNSDAIRAQENFLDKVSVLDLRTENKVFYRFNE